MANRKPGLNDVHRAFIVDQLACFASLDEIKKALLDLYQIEVPKATIAYYNPTTVQGAAQLSEKWKTAFAARRKRFRADIEDIPTANLAVRLQIRDRRIQALLARPSVNELLVNELL